jgi:hypothetical protein
LRDPERSLPMPRTLEQNIRAVTDYLLEIEGAGTPYDWWREGDPPWDLARRRRRWTGTPRVRGT